MHHPSPDSYDIAYFASAFPVLTETFIYNEMIALRELGFSPVLAVFRSGDRKTVHRHYMERLSSLIIYAPPILSWTHLRAHFHFIVQRPTQYLHMLAQIIRSTARRPMILAKSLYAFGKGVALARVLEGHSVQHLHGQWAHNPTTAAWVVSQLLNIPFSFTARAYDIYKKASMLVEKMQAASFAVTITNYNRVYLRSLCPELTSEIPVIQSALDLERFPFSPPPPIALLPSPPLLLCVARLVETKGLPWLIEACGVFKDRNVPFRCEIVGDGPLRPALEKMIAERGLDDTVQLRGKVPQDVIRSLLQVAAVFALPSVVARNGDRDGIPNALMEAMATGVPVVSTDVSGIPELVEHEVTGLVAPPKDAQALALAIERLLNDQPLRTRLAQRARQRVEQNHDVRVNTRRKAELFRQAIARENSELS